MKNTQSFAVLALVGLASAIHFAPIAMSAIQSSVQSVMSTEQKDHAQGKKYFSPTKALQKISMGSKAELMYEESWSFPWEGLVQRPQNLEIVGGMYNPDKNRVWNEKEQADNRAALDFLRNSPPPSTYLSNVLTGTWTARGPKNKPGSFVYADLDSTDNTMWAITNGHYSGTNNVFKGSLAGDDFKLITGNLATRFNDLAGFSVGSHKRVLVTTEAGQAYYSDDDGVTWNAPSGLPTSGIQSLSLNRAGAYKAYVSDGQKVYVSNDSGRTYSVLQDFGTKVAETKLYAIRYGKQPGAGNLYYARNGSFYKLVGSSFTLKGTYPQPVAKVNNNGWGRFEMQGDTRKLYLHEYNRYFSSTDEGSTWTSVAIPSYYYGSLAVHTPAEYMVSDHTFGVNPSDPNIIIGGYSDWEVSKDGGLTVQNHDAGWGHYQGGSTVAIQDQYTREGHHPDLQGSSFFYDKNGQIVSIRCSDGGIFRSYKEWSLSSWTGTDWTVYYNITLYNTPTQETYLNSLASGSKSPDHISTGTQDQGDQTTMNSGVPSLDVLQNPGGDGRTKVTADGLNAYGFGSDGTVTSPSAMYSGTTFNGTRNMGSNSYSTGNSSVSDLVVDKALPATSFWTLGSSLIYSTWTGSAYTNSTRTPTGSGSLLALAQSKSNPNVIYAVKGANIFKSSNKGSSWGTAVAWGGNPNGRCGLAVSATDENKVLVACKSSNAVRSAFSANGGATWTNTTSTLIATDVNDMIAEKTGRLMFASTTYGPYVFDTQSLTWSSMIETGVPYFNGMSMEYLESYDIVRYSTWGLGIYDFKITAIGTGTGTSSSSIISSSSITSSSSIANSSSSSNNGSSVGISSSVVASSNSNTGICNGVNNWNSATIYDVAGLKVVHANALFSSKWWTQNDTPDKLNSSGPWAYVGDCGAVKTLAKPVQIQLSSWDKNQITLLGNGLLYIRLSDIDGRLIQEIKGSAGQSLRWNKALQKNQYILEVKQEFGLKRWMISVD